MTVSETVEPTNKLGGANRKTRKLIEKNQRLEFIPTLTPILAIMLFGITIHLPFVFVAFMFFIGEIGYGLTGSLCYTGLLIGCLMISLWLFKRVTYPIYFDLREGYFCSKNKSSSNNIRTCDIKNLHVVRKKVLNGSDSYKSFELLLMLNDGSKVMVIDHADGNTLKRDAETLAERLNVPWSSSVYS